MRELMLISILILSQFSLFSHNGENRPIVFRDTLEPQSIKEIEAKNPPINIVFIMTDNQGAWTHGCYGNQDIKTQNIDRLAKEGIRYTQALSSNPVCSPTRATFLTGLLPSQHGIHSFLDQKYQMGPEAYNAISEFTTLPEVLNEAGYVCGLTGKWHLGDNLNPGKGFSYWVTKPEGGTSGFYEKEVIENGKVRIEEGYTTDFWTKKAIKFIETNKEKPFFLLLTYNGPYGLNNKVMLHPASNRWAEYYKDKHFKSFPADRIHPWQDANKGFHNKQISMERYASEVSGIDDGVGKVIETLEHLGLDSNTLVIYTADQGWMGGQNGLWGMGDHTLPIAAHELMMKIPLIFWQPGVIKADQTSDLLVSNYDLMPSLLSYLGLEDKMPIEPKSPGRDFSFDLMGKSNPDWENEIFYEMERTRAIRNTNWKYVARYPNGPFELYNMTIDPQERFNMFGQPGSAEKANKLADELDVFFTKYANPEFNVWKKGHSKAKLHTPEAMSNYNEEYFQKE